MKLTYIFHSGFVLETNQSILIFDFWMDPVGIMESVLCIIQPLPRRSLQQGNFRVEKDKAEYNIHSEQGYTPTQESQQG